MKPPFPTQTVVTPQASWEAHVAPSVRCSFHPSIVAATLRPAGHPLPAARACASHPFAINCSLPVKGMTMPHRITSPIHASRGIQYTLPERYNVRSPKIPLVTLAALWLILLLTGCASTNMGGYEVYRYDPSASSPLNGGPADYTDYNRCSYVQVPAPPTVAHSAASAAEEISERAAPRLNNSGTVNPPGRRPARHATDDEFDWPTTSAPGMELPRIDPHAYSLDQE